MSIELTSNQYGKARVRLLRVARRASRHDVIECTLHIRFRGDFDDTHIAGDNRNVLPTDTMKNTVYALARDQAPAEIEEFSLRLVRHFLDGNPKVREVAVDAVENPWTRISDTAFERRGAGKRLAWISGSRTGVTVEAGLDDLTLLKTTGSAFAGFRRDDYTTLPETVDRLLATTVQARWKYSSAGVAYGEIFGRVRERIVRTFAAHDSLSVQHTGYEIGRAVLENEEAIDQISLILPNRHCLLVDLAPFGRDNPNEVFLPIDEPHGQIEVHLSRGDLSPSC